MKYSFAVLVLVAAGLLCHRVFSARPARAADARELMDAYHDVLACQVDVTTTVDVRDFVLERNGTRFTFDSGRVVFFAPVSLDSVMLTYGAYFEGRGSFGFIPAAEIERHQLRTYFGKSQLAGTVHNLLLFYSDGLLDSLLLHGTKSIVPFTPSDVAGVCNRLSYYEKNEPHEFSFALFRNLVDRSSDPFLWVNADPEGVGRIICIHDPYLREEIQLYKIRWEPGGSKIEPVISCSRTLRADHTGINGQDKSRLRITHYDLNCTISPQGDFGGKAVITAWGRSEPTQLLRLWLHPELTVRSVRDEFGSDVTFLRHEHEDYPSLYLYLFLERPLRPLNGLTLTVEYDGEDMITEHVGDFYMTAHSYWYPSVVDRNRATFDMTFHTPRALEFVAAGDLVERRVEGDELVTLWKVDTPCKNVSFSLGAMKKYEFKDEAVGSVDVYYSEDLHAEMAMQLVEAGNLVGKHMERQVSDDVFGALKLFDHDFGPGPTTHLAVSEIMEFHGEAFPGFLHMGLPTWVTTDVWGYQRQFRAHEVAHQWWGVGVGYDTYHDQWLSEGLAEYSALLYLQATEGNDRFLNTLRDYRDELFSAEKLGPVALGFRNSTKNLPDGYDIAVYKKGAYVMHMIRNLFLDLSNLGDERFFNLLREYYRTYRGADATTHDFQVLAEKYAGTDLGWFFDQWVYSTELPTYDFSYELAKQDDGSFAAHCMVDVENVPPDFKMFVPVEVELNKGQKAYLRYLIEGTGRQFEISGLPVRPKRLLLNPFESVLAKVKQ